MNFIIFDTETTGFSPRKNEVIEYGAVRMDQDGKEIDSFSSFVKIERKVPEKITEITGITNEMLEEAPDSKTVLQKLVNYCGERAVFVAHNADFDREFLFYEFKRNNMEVPSQWLFWDSLKLSKTYITQLQNHKLGTICEKLGIDLTNAHRALDDARGLAGIFKHIIDSGNKISDIRKNAGEIKLNSYEECFTDIPEEFFSMQGKNLEIKEKISGEEFDFRPIICYKIKNRVLVLGDKGQENKRTEVDFQNIEVLREKGANHG